MLKGTPAERELTVVAVNDMADLQTNAHLFRYDSTYGIFPGRIETGEGVLKIDDWEIMVLNQKDPSRLPWRALGVDIVMGFNRRLYRRRSCAGPFGSGSEEGDYHCTRHERGHYLGVGSQ